ncbi:MAG: hypothetical protein BYD32DRAFT_413230 [Podila humilis]|nr:MAG: hypothetical protein BYD32DRAFT_413230 [Podila humilis]
MLQSVMVFPNNDFFNVAPLLDDNVAKLINTDQIESYMTSASSSPIQDYLLAPSSMASFHPQQHPNHHRHNTSQIFPVSMPSMVAHSAPSSPSYPVKNEESMDYLLYPSFDLASSPQQQNSPQQPQVLPSQSPQQRMVPYTDVSLLQQRQHHQQQQQQHAQQLRLQHQRAIEQQQQYQMSTVTSAIISSIAANTNIMTPSTFNTNSISTPAPFDAPAFNFSNNGVTYAAHPAAPKRKREEPTDAMVHVTPSPSSSSTVVAPLSPSISSPSLSVSTPTLTASRISTSSRLDKVKPVRSTKVTKSTSSSSSSPSTSMISSAATTTASSSSSIKSLAKKTTKKSVKDSEDVDSSASIEASTSTATPHTGNITHPRRAAQNRAAQRTFRNRRKAYIKELEQKVLEMDRTREMMETIHHENQEVWRRVQILEALASQSGLQLPIFPAMTPFAGMEASGSPYGGQHMMMGHSHPHRHGSSSSSNEDEEDDEEMRELSHSQASYIDPRFHHHQNMDMHRQL